MNQSHLLFLWEKDEFKSMENYVLSLEKTAKRDLLSTLVKEMEGLKQDNQQVSEYYSGFNEGINKAIEVIQSRYLR